VRRIIIIFSVLISCVISMQDAISKSIDSDSSKVFLLLDSTKLFWYEEYNDTFDHISGFIENSSCEDRIKHIQMITGADDTIYVNTLMGNWVQSETLSCERDSYTIRRINLSTHDNSSLNQRKKYDYRKSIWQICNYSDDWSYFSGSEYASNRTAFYKISDEDNFAEDKFLTKLVFFILILLAFYIIIPLWYFEKLTLAWIILGLATSLSFTFILKWDIIMQLILPLICIIATACLFYVPGYAGIIRAIGQTVLGSVIIIFFAYKQFYCIDEHIRLQDGYELNVTWKRGTGLLKRAYVRKILLNLTPVTVNADDDKYTLFVSKHEFSEGNLFVISDETFACFFAGIERPLYCFSFREAQLVLEHMKLLTGVNLDFLTYAEWSSLAGNKRHSPNDLDYCKVKKGEVSADGLVNITSNMPEFTSSYYGGNYRISMAADTMYRSYNNILVAGSAYECTDSINVSVVNKNVRNGLAGFRLVFRPNDVGARKFTINGYLRNDKEYTGLPEKIKLVSIDGDLIDHLPNYESFEELLIEGRLKKRRFEGVDLACDTLICFTQPEGLEYYDFEPEFSFVRSTE